MAYKKALTEGEVLSVNFKSVRSWLKANKSKVKARPHKTMFYSGRDYKLEVLKTAKGKVIEPNDRKTFMGTPMWKRIEKTSEKRAKQNFDIKFETINDVLKKLKSPRIIDKDHIEIGYANAYECFDDLKRKPKLFPKPDAAKAWSLLSEFFAENAEGYIKILDGVADDYGKLGDDKDFILKELPKLMNNKNLSKKSKDDLKKLISKYGSSFDHTHSKLMREINESYEALGKKRRK